MANQKSPKWKGTEDTYLRRLFDWIKVTSGVSAGLSLGAAAILIYENDIPEGLQSYFKMIEDDANLFKEIRSTEGRDNLQGGEDNIHHCSGIWLMRFNLTKCKVMRIGHSKMRSG